jgi:hypothetical protein
MQKNYAKDGLVALSVEVSSLDEKDLKEWVIKTLKSKNATNFKTVILNEKDDFWQKKLRFDNFPCIYVFNREGKWTQFRSQDSKYNKIEAMLDAVDSLAKTLLKQK